MKYPNLISILTQDLEEMKISEMVNSRKTPYYVTYIYIVSGWVNYLSRNIILFKLITCVGSQNNTFLSMSGMLIKHIKTCNILFIYLSTHILYIM